MEKYKTIPLTQNQFAIVDEEDFQSLSAHKWQAQWNSCTQSFYAVRCAEYTLRKCTKTCRMNRYILGLEYGDKRQGDHINGNTLDNRKKNLRVATHLQNMMNKKDICE